MRKNPVERASGLEHPIGGSSIPTCSSEIFSVAPSSVAKKLPLRHFLQECLRHQSIFQIKRLLVTSRLTVLLKYPCMIVNIQRLRFLGGHIFLSFVATTRDEKNRLLQVSLRPGVGTLHFKMQKGDITSCQRSFDQSLFPTET